MSFKPIQTAALFVLSGTLAGAQAQSSCSSDGVKPPRVIVERFIRADCQTCWARPDATPSDAATMTLDWVVPAGTDAALAAAALPEARERMTLRGGSAAPAAHRTELAPGTSALRVAHGLPVNNYIGASIELVRAGRAQGELDAWLLLVEALPAGTEGSPVARNLVRNVLQLRRPAGNAPWREVRPMSLPAGTQPGRLRVFGWVQDASGAVLATALSNCPPQPRKTN